MLKGGERKGQAVRQMRTSQTRANVDSAVTGSGTPGKLSPVQCLEALRGRLQRSSRAWNLTPGSGACCIPVPLGLLLAHAVPIFPFLECTLLLPAALNFVLFPCQELQLFFAANS